MNEEIKHLYRCLLSNKSTYTSIKRIGESYYQITHDFTHDRRVVVQDFFIYPTIRFGNDNPTKAVAVRRRPR